MAGRESAETTESRNLRTVDIDTVSVSDRIELLLSEEERMLTAVRRVASDIARLVEEVISRLAAGGRLHYFGAGASGRLAFVDVSEINPTFGYPRDRVIAHFPGGDQALLDSSLDLEDAYEAGLSDAEEVSPNDIVVGITASGRTQYVAGALQRSQERGACCALITMSADSSLLPLVNIGIFVETGAEAITGSTRMKAGTATKIILNTVSTAAMVGLGCTYSNLMINLVASNHKLRGRAIRVLQQATGASAEVCEERLAAAQGLLPVALVSMLLSVDVAAADDLLTKRKSVRAVIEGA